MKKRVGRVLALILAMSLIMANVCAASATDSQAGVAEPAVQENVSEEIQEEEAEVLPEETEMSGTTEEQEDTEPAEQPEDSEVTEGQNAEEEQTVVTEENTVAEVTALEAVKELRYENEEVTVVVSAEQEGAIPEGVSLKVVPVTAKDNATKAQYEEVKKQVEAKAEKEENKIAGFLASDITFVDAQGNEVEPNGSVKVSMEYKKGVVPKGLSEADVKDTDVTVYHLEEDENGNVKDVVDMGAAKQVKELSATDKNEVKKLEVQTESFSAFAIVWNYSGRNNLKVTAHYGYNDENGNWQDIPRQDIPNFPNQITIDKAGKEIDLTSHEREISGYTFENIKVDNPKTGENVSKLRSSSEKKGWPFSTTIYYIKYIKQGETQAQDWLSSSQSGKKEGDIYFVYELDNPVEEIPTISNAKDLGISINLFNYNGEVNNTRMMSTAKAGFKFHNMHQGVDGTNNMPEDIKYTHPHQQAVHQEYLKSNLSGTGYPVLRNGTSLSDLFSEAKSSVVKSYKNLDGLLSKDAQGYYTYDSTNYHAQLLEKEKRIAVYNAALSPEKKTFNYGNFLPFNKLPENAGSGKIHSVSGGMAKTDYWYGMNLSTVFIQPKDGKINKESMKFEFRGDDDTWVFIDGVKVLDIGGIHDKTAGSIDFATGKVLVDGVAETTLADLYKQAYKEKNPNATNRQITKYLDGIFEKNRVGAYTTFKNYSPHEMKFFYLERGGGAANCMIKFNIPPTPPKSITVEKEIENYDEGAYNDVKFSYELYINGKLQKDIPYTLIKANGDREKLRVDENGIFKLKHKEQAQFLNCEPTDTYYVKEVGIESGTYDKVTIESSGVRDENNVDIGAGGYGYVQSEKLIVGDNPYVKFLNRCAATNMKQLKITKKLQEGVSSEQAFEVQVTVGGKPYNGEYLRKPNGKKESTINGIIKIKPNETITVLGNVKTENGEKVGFPSGTSFEVKEINYDSNTYRTPIYEIESGTADDPLTDGKASGKFNKDANANVTITNILKESEKPEEVPHSKTIDYLGDGEKNTDTELTGEEFYRLYLDVTGIPSVKPDPADIVLVLGYSSSMSESYEGYGTRFKGVKAAAKIAINTLLPEDTENRVGVVWFDEWVNEDDIISFTDNKAVLIENIENKQQSSGTNYQAAFQNVQKLLEKESGIDRKKFVIFVTDGEPYQWVKNGKPVNTGRGDAKLHAAEEVKNFKDLFGFYAVSVGKNTGKDFLQNDIVGNAPAPLKDTLEANNKTELENAFGKVLGSITKQIGNVTITDELTEYVQFAGEDGVEYIGSQSGTQSNVADNLVSLKVTVRDKSAPANQAKEYKGNYTWSIDDKKVTVSFGNDFFLERDKIYSISFNVKLTDKAYQSYENNQEYSNVGDAGTDYLNNATSSEKPGFYSNKEATVSYKRVVIRSDSVVEQTETQQYAKPVVQVSSKKDWQMIKVSDSNDALKLKGAEFILTKDDKVYVGISDENGQIEWTIDNQPIDEKDIPAGTYILEETKAPAGYMKSDDSWTVVISNTEPPTVTSNSSNKELDVKDEDGDGVYEIEISNKPLFELPSNGGNGIYWYMVGGVLLLTATGMLILYKRRREEVLGS